jgi:hypothetical protein
VLIYFTIKVSYSKHIRPKTVATNSRLQRVTQSRRKKWGRHCRGGRAVAVGWRPRASGPWVTSPPRRSHSRTRCQYTMSSSATTMIMRASTSEPSSCWRSTVGRYPSRCRSRHPPSPTASSTMTSSLNELEPHGGVLRRARGGLGRGRAVAEPLR